MLKVCYSVADQNFAQGKSLGILNMSLNLLGRLAQRPELERIQVLSNRTLRDQLPQSPRVCVEEHDTAIASRLQRIAWDQWGVYRAARATASEWLVLPKGFASFVRPCPLRLATIVYDAMHDHYRRHYPHAISRLEAAYFDRALVVTLRDSEVIFTDSHFAGTEVHRLARERGLKLPTVIPIGVGFSVQDAQLARNATAEGPRSGVVLLTSRWPHKRTAQTVLQLAAWQKRSLFDEPIHLVGSRPEGLVLPPGPRWEAHARLSNDDYARLVSGARVLIFASDYEGFGMPPVEACLAGTCPVYSDLPVTQEVMQGAGCPYRNDDAASFSQAMDRALTMPRPDVAAWAAELAARHNWGRVCDLVVKALATERHP